MNTSKQAVIDVRAFLNATHSNIMARAKPTPYQRLIAEKYIPFLREVANRMTSMDSDRMEDVRTRVEKGRTSRSKFWKDVCIEFAQFMDLPEWKQTTGNGPEAPAPVIDPVGGIKASLIRDKDLKVLKEAYARLHNHTNMFLGTHHPNASAEARAKFINSLRG
jgi:hypothetical protein